ncbi:MAG TPA: MFS transporter [Ktedonobacterales bacterium]|nr:MFS transporter [Ktedonobacterales bacterium]
MSKPTTGGLWRNRDFLLLWAGQAISSIGSQISGFALPLLVLALTNSPAQAGLLTALQRVPYLLFSLPVGVLIDRWNRKRVMLLANALRCAVYALVPSAFLLDHLTLPLLAVVAVLSGAAYVFFDLADNSAFPRIVTPAQLPNAAALMEGTFSAADLLGPGIGGLIVGLARTVVSGAALAYLADSISYLASMLGLLWIRTPFQASRTGQASVSLRTEVMAGLRFLLTHPRLRVLALLTMGITLLTNATTLALIVLARSTLRINPLTLGLIFASGGLGGVLGAGLMPWLSARATIGWRLLGCALLWAASAALLALAQSPLLLVAGWAILTMMNPVYFATSYAYRVSLVDDALQGRVNSVYRLMSQLGLALGPGLGGALLVIISARTELWLIAIGFGLCVALIGLTGLRAVGQHPSSAEAAR